MGLDGIHPKVLREVLTEPRSIICWQSWLTRQIAAEWRWANVMPIYQKGGRRIQGTAVLSVWPPCQGKSWSRSSWVLSCSTCRTTRASGPASTIYSLQLLLQWEGGADLFFVVPADRMHGNYLNHQGNFRLNIRNSSSMRGWSVTGASASGKRSWFQTWCLWNIWTTLLDIWLTSRLPMWSQ